MRPAVRAASSPAGRLRLPSGALRKPPRTGGMGRMSRSAASASSGGQQGRSRSSSAHRTRWPRASSACARNTDRISPPMMPNSNMISLPSMTHSMRQGRFWILGWAWRPFIAGAEDIRFFCGSGLMAVCGGFSISGRVAFSCPYRPRRAFRGLYRRADKKFTKSPAFYVFLSL